tara:strand:- start:1247 stop:1984 length:738 start_codon:yes stop_codon:yes gene_type:complete
MTRPFNACSHIEIDGTRYPYLNDDAPFVAYQREGISFVAQPLDRKSEDFGVIPVPLMMTDEWEIIKEEPSFIEELRATPKDHDFNFMGQTNYAGRSVFRHLKLPRYIFQETSPVYSLEPHVKKEVLKDFLRAIARAKFVFCPRGIGSSSFRAYQSLMAGSIPIITGMNDYPFKNQVDWDDFCFRGGEGARWTELGEQNAEEVSRLTSKATQLSEDEYEQMRSNGMKFWDEYCRHDRLYEKLKDMV